MATRTSPRSAVRADPRLAEQRVGIVSRVADALRDQIVEGTLVPGTRLSEDETCAALGVSRSTLREAFQVLIRERLVEHRLNRGVFVRSLDVDDVRDLYRVRRMVECTAVRDAQSVPAEALRLLTAAVEDGQAAAKRRRWSEVSSASIRFHLALVGLARSPRADEIIGQLMAEFKLAYAVMDHGSFHLPFLRRHPAILAAIQRGELADAEALLRSYLDDAEAKLVAVLGSATEK